LIKKLKKELKGSRNLMTLYLSYKLLKEYIKREPEKKKMFYLNFYFLIKMLNRIAEIVNNVFVPLVKIYSFQSDKKTSLKFTFLAKLQKMLNQ